jgi:serine O-acetyltransferase
VHDSTTAASPSLKAQLREDLATHRGKLSAPGLHALAVHRLGVWGRSRPRWRRRAVEVVYRALYALVRTVYGVELPRQAVVGRRLELPHPVGVIISPEAVIGDDCLVRQGVTIGRFTRGRARRPPHAPRLGDRVEVGAGAVVVGGITVGDDVRIGPNAVVMTDLPPGSSAFAPPTRVLPPTRRGAADAGAAGAGTATGQGRAPTSSPSSRAS